MEFSFSVPTSGASVVSAFSKVSLVITEAASSRISSVIATTVSPGIASDSSSDILGSTFAVWSPKGLAPSKVSSFGTIFCGITLLSKSESSILITVTVTDVLSVTGSSTGTAASVTGSSATGSSIAAASSPVPSISSGTVVGISSAISSGISMSPEFTWSKNCENSSSEMPLSSNAVAITSSFAGTSSATISLTSIRGSASGSTAVASSTTCVNAWGFKRSR